MKRLIKAIKYKIKRWMVTRRQKHRIREALLIYNKAITNADKLFAVTGERQFVMLDGKRELIPMCRSVLRELKHKKIIHNRYNVNNMEWHCVYHTSHANGSGAMSPELKEERKQMYVNLYAKIING